MFFYNPTEWSSTLSGGILPSLSLFREFKVFMEHLSRQTTGLDLRDTSLRPAEVRDAALPIKYGMKMLPVTKS
ncbi:MAG: hypothetical protein CM15mV19_0810 [uncultured marine virus]|nr:MAG: hypothetical protein CM15mV19_0810 [uncultured marine virus]